MPDAVCSGQPPAPSVGQSMQQPLCSGLPGPQSCRGVAEESSLSEVQERSEVCFRIRPRRVGQHFVDDESCEEERLFRLRHGVGDLVNPLVREAWRLRTQTALHVVVHRLRIVGQ